MMRFLAPGALAFCTLSAAVRAQAPEAAAAKYASADLTQLSLDELGSIKVLSVSKRPVELSKTAAAIHVITGDDLRRSGATSLVEALRLVPGVHVARLTSSQTAIGIRGFTSRLARAQLPLIDGRSLYTTLFAGTYWEVQDTLLEDIERIEVVRGPGGTLWGANAVTGIVNVITKTAKETQGGLVAAAGGLEDRALVRARYGGKLGDRGHYRVYGKYSDRDALFRPAGSEFDGWNLAQGGFRGDWSWRESDEFTLQGDVYRARIGERTNVTSFEAPFTTSVERKNPVSGGNLRTRWAQRSPGGNELALRAYYDHFDRESPSFKEVRDTFDLEAIYRPAPRGRHTWVLGAGYRLSSGRTEGVETLAFVPADRTDDLASAFVEDELTLVQDRLRVSLGTKLEWNDYTGVELQPSARLIWTPSGHHSLWAAATRAVRTPSRIERGLTGIGAVNPPLFSRLSGSPDFETEVSWVYELGGRVRAADRLFVELAAYYNRYPNLLSIEVEPPVREGPRQILPLVFHNGTEGGVMGGELAADVRLSDRWRVRLDYAFLNMDLKARPGSTDTSSAAAEDASPRHNVAVWSSFQLGGKVELDARYRWVARLPSQRIDDYSTLDLRVGWRPKASVELALVGGNLLADHHAEFGGALRGEVERTGYVEARWRW